MSRPVTPDGDEEAQRRLCAGMQPLPPGWSRPDLEARTRFFDGVVLSAIAAGVSQIVVVGAGYDDRSVRFRSAGVRFFELDHPATQADKGRRLRSIGGEATVLAPADFRSDDVSAALAACGHESGQPSLFTCEGLLVYLDEETIVRLLTGLRQSAHPASSLAASLALHDERLDSRVVLQVANDRRRTAEAEPWRTILPREQHLALLTESGWEVGDLTDAAHLDADVAPGRSLLVTARPS